MSPLLLLAVLLADERVLPLARTESFRDLQEITTIVRAIVEPVQVTLEAKNLRVQGSAEQIKVADWLVRELDEPTGKAEYTVADDDRIHIFKFSDAKDIRELQESGTVVRSMAEIRRLFIFNSPQKIVMRGTKAQIEQAAWILDHLPNTAGSSETAEMKLPPDQLLRVYPLPQFKSATDLQEATTLLRSISEIRYALLYSATNRLVLRGSAQQMAMVDFMLKEFELSSDSKTMHRSRGSRDSVRVFDQSGATDLEQTATALRSLAANRVYALESRHKIVLRGMPDEVALGEWMLSQDADKQDFQLGVVRRFHLPFATNVQEFQEAATAVRSVGEIYRLVADNASKSVFVRGSQSEVDLADWLFRQLATPPVAAESREYKYGGDIVRIFFLKRDAMTVQQLQETATRVRRETRIPRMFTYNAYRAIIVRGTPVQAAQAATLFIF